MTALENPLKSGMVLLGEYLEIAARDTACEGLQSRTDAHRRMSQAAARSIKAAWVPADQGVYLWGNYGRNGLWTNVYFGKAGFGQGARLNGRLLEELRDERIFAYVRPGCSEEEESARLLTLAEANSPARMWDKYKNHNLRSVRKRGTTHIAWVSVPRVAPHEVGELEAELIESLNPRANMVRAAPPTVAGLAAVAGDVFRELRQVIHAHRPKRTPLKGVQMMVLPAPPEGSAAV